MDSISKSLLQPRDDRYLEFRSGLTTRQSAKVAIEASSHLITKERAVRDAFDQWWNTHAKKIAKLAGQTSFVGVRNAFLKTFSAALDPLALLDIYQVRGIVAGFWDQARYDFLTLMARGCKGVIDAWRTSILTALEDEESKNDPLDHKLVRFLMQDFAASVAELESRKSELDAQIKAATPKTDEEEDDESSEDEQEIDEEQFLWPPPRGNTSDSPGPNEVPEPPMSCPRSRLAANVAIASLIFLLGSACSQEQPAAAAERAAPEPNATVSMPAAGIDACAWISQEEGATALGEAVDAPANQVVIKGGKDQAAISQCSYQSSKSPARTLTVFARRSPVPDHNPAAVRETLSSAGVSAEEISGIGEHAFWAAGQLHVFAPRNLYLLITLKGAADADEGRRQALDIAQRILERA